VAERPITTLSVSSAWTRASTVAYAISILRPPLGEDVVLSDQAVMPAYVSAHVHMRDMTVEQEGADASKVYVEAGIEGSPDVERRPLAWAAAVAVELRLDYTASVLECSYDFTGAPHRQVLRRHRARRDGRPPKLAAQQ
jgi:hypothetical protein